MNSKLKGTAGLGKAIAHFTALGYCVCLPLNDSQPYDLIVESKNVPGFFQRVQVKTTTHRTPSGAFQVGLRTCGGNKSRQTIKHFKSTSCDVLFVVTEEGNYLIPTTDITAGSTLDLGTKYNRYRV